MHSGLLGKADIEDALQEAGNRERGPVEGDVAGISVEDQAFPLEADLRQQSLHPRWRVDLIAGGERVMLGPLVKPSGKILVRGVGQGANEPHVVVPCVGREEEHSAVRFQHTVHLTEDLLGSFQMFENPGKRHDIEELVLERKVLGVRDHGVLDRRVVGQRVRVQVYAIAVRRSAIHLCQVAGVAATADVEHPGGLVDLLADQSPVNRRAGIPLGPAFLVELPPIVLPVHCQTDPAPPPTPYPSFSVPGGAAETTSSRE